MPARDDDNIDPKNYPDGLQSVIPDNDAILDGTHAQIIHDFGGFVCQIQLMGLGNDPVVGTGFLVGPDLVLTNFHVVYKQQLKSALDSSQGKSIKVTCLRCRFDVRRIGPKSYDTGTKVDVSEILAFSRFSKLENNGTDLLEVVEQPDLGHLDYALLKLERAIGEESIRVNYNTEARRGWIDLPKHPPQNDPTSDVYVLQFPKDSFLSVSEGPFWTPERRFGSRIRHKASTKPGSSGSPYFCWIEEKARTNSDFTIVGIHNYGDPSWDNKLKPEFNHGVPIELITEDLRKKKIELPPNPGFDPGSLTKKEPAGEKTDEGNPEVEPKPEQEQSPLQEPVPELTPNGAAPHNLPDASKKTTSSKIRRLTDFFVLHPFLLLIFGPIIFGVSFLIVIGIIYYYPVVPTTPPLTPIDIPTTFKDAIPCYKKGEYYCVYYEEKSGELSKIYGLLKPNDGSKLPSYSNLKIGTILTPYFQSINYRIFPRTTPTTKEDNKAPGYRHPDGTREGCFKFLGPSWQITDNSVLGDATSAGYIKAKHIREQKGVDYSPYLVAQCYNWKDFKLGSGFFRDAVFEIPEDGNPVAEDTYYWVRYTSNGQGLSDGLAGTDGYRRFDLDSDSPLKSDEDQYNETAEKGYLIKVPKGHKIAFKHNDRGQHPYEVTGSYAWVDPRDLEQIEEIATHFGLPYRGK